MRKTNQKPGNREFSDSVEAVKVLRSRCSFTYAG